MVFHRGGGSTGNESSERPFFLQPQTNLPPVRLKTGDLPSSPKIAGAVRHVMSIEPMGKIPLGTILRYDYEVRDDKELARSAPSPRIPKEMLKLASHILDTKAGHFDPSQFKDEFELELRKLVKRKAAGKTIEAPEREERPSNVVDLMEALRQSVSGRGNRAAALRSSSSSRKTANRSRAKLQKQTHDEAGGVTPREQSK